ncbi:MAG: aminotransferase class IV [Pontibacter sp.]|nr:aminotransferase class IV [Pontibacter sp.]
MPLNVENYAYVRGEIVPLQDAKLHVSDLSIQRGYGVFDFCKVQNGQPLFLQDYLNRFRASAQLMQMEVPLSDHMLEGVIQELIRKNNLPHGGIKMILTGGYSDNGYEPAEPSLVILQQPLTLPGPEMVEKGIKIITHEYVREIPVVKTINYTMGIRLIEQIRQRGASDVLYLQKGIVTEFPRCNLFIVTNENTVRTPAADVLLGITRKNVLQLARKRYRIEEGPVPLEDVYSAKEVLLTSTTKRILPIVQVDEQVIGTGKPGNITLSLLQELIALEEKMIRQKAL